MEPLCVSYDPALGCHDLKIAGRGETTDVLFYGTNERLESLAKDIELVGCTEAKVIITGETGTGKTTLARAIHLRHEKRGAHRFRRTNVGALVPELAASQLFGHKEGAFTGATRDHVGIVEASDRGTFFMDEISAASDTVQVMLLTLLETQIVNKVGAGPADKPTKVDVRFMAATTQPLNVLRDSKTFRTDLFFRLAEYHIAIPPLREHREEIPVLAHTALVGCQKTHRTGCTPLLRIDDAALKRLEAYGWPGNVRELQSVIRAAVVRSREYPRETVLRAKYLRFHMEGKSNRNRFDEQQSWPEAKDAFQRSWVNEALERCGTAAEVGRRYGIDQKTIRKYRSD
ncbi:MAG TPA: sigma 54-interacting transcriptional regulator [Bryobacteraceae bacterium]|jgi:DNA-binding NtrC family response regulator